MSILYKKFGPGGGLWNTNRKGFVDSTLNANKGLDFVKRLYGTNNPSIQVPGEPDRSTHLMAYDPRSKRVYPEVVRQNGQLTHLSGDDAWDYADKSKEFIQFKTPQQANWFSSNGYKIGTGVNNTIDPNGKPYNDPNYKIHALGGTLKDENNFGGAAVTGAGIGVGLIDAFDQPNEYGNQSSAGMIGKSALTGAASGAAIAGPIGAAVGGGLGLLTGFIGAGKARRQEQAARQQMRTTREMVDRNNSNARIAGDNSLVNGYRNAQMFKDGGFLGEGGGKKVDKVPDGYNFDREEAGRKYFTKKGSTQMEAASGKGQGGAGYELFLQQKLANGVSPDDLVAKKYIGADQIGKYKSYYKPSIDTVYTEGVPSTPVPAVAKRGQPIYGTNKHIAGEIFYGTRDSENVSDPGTLNSAVQNARIKFRNDFGYTGEEVEIPGTDVQKYLGTTHTFGSDGLYNELKGRSSKATSKLAYGGTMKSPLVDAYMQGGQAKSLSSNSTEILGNSHEEGGVKMPQLGAEVENGETTSGNFVFSKELGFAKLHKPIAKAMGIIEKKPQTPERLAAMKLLKNQENKLALTQEYLKKSRGIQ